MWLVLRVCACANACKWIECVFVLSSKVIPHQYTINVTHPHNHTQSVFTLIDFSTKLKTTKTLLRSWKNPPPARCKEVNTYNYNKQGKFN